MKRILIMIFLLVGLTIPPDPVKTFKMDETQITQGAGYLTEVDYFCSYICQQNGADPDYCKKLCFNEK